MRRCLPIGLALFAGGCSGSQSALDPQGTHADQIAWLIGIFTAICAVIWVLVVATLIVALVRSSPVRTNPLNTDAGREHTFGRITATLAVLTGAIVIGLTVLSYASQRDVFGKSAEALNLRVIGHQWWWEVRYDDEGSEKSFNSANEIHIPVGRPVKVVLQSRDVIHSFWVPSLAGKMDQIPGIDDNQLQFNASKPGVYRGQCAEFCGHQHAHMAMFIIAHNPDEFRKWRADQLDTSERLDTEQETGKRVFFTRGCALCHTIRGTRAGGILGPDLTHLASRRAIAAGTLPMSRGNLAAWIANPQQIKPGANMPPARVEAAELNALTAYLMGLQ